jgi:hypothetical protein
MTKLKPARARVKIETNSNQQQLKQEMFHEVFQKCIHNCSLTVGFRVWV